MHLLRDWTWSYCFAHFWSRLIEQVILVSFKKRSFQIRRVRVSEHRTTEQIRVIEKSHMTNYKASARAHSLRLPLIALLLTSFNTLTDFPLPLSFAGAPVSVLFIFWPRNFGPWSSDPIISWPWSSISGSFGCEFCCSISYSLHIPIQFSVDQTNRCASYTSVPEYRLRVLCELIMRLHPIWYQILERLRLLKIYWIDHLLPGNTHISWKRAVIREGIGHPIESFCSARLILFLEVWVLNDLFQGIKHLKVGWSTPSDWRRWLKGRPPNRPSLLLVL